MEQLRFQAILFFISLIDAEVPIFKITEERMPDACQMRPDLMCLSRDQMYFQKRQSSIPRHRMILGFDPRRFLIGNLL